LVGLLSRNNNSTRYAANLQILETPDSVITRKYRVAAVWGICHAASITKQTSHRMTALEWAMLVTLSVVWGGSFFFAAIAVAEVPPWLG
jgi:hypothetical protein